MPIYNFFTITATGDYSYVIKQKYRNIAHRFDPQALQNAWNIVFNEYTDISSKDGGSVAVIMLIKNMAVTYNELLIAGGLVRSLYLAHNDDAAGALINMGYKYEYDIMNPEASHKYLERATTKLKGLARRYEDLKAAYDAEIAKHSKDGPGYEQTLADLSRFQGYRLDKYTVTVTEYLSIIDQYQEHVKATKRNGKR